MKNLLVIVLLILVAGFAMIIGSRLPVDSITVLVGVGCGVLASIPTSVLTLALATRFDRQRTGLQSEDYRQVKRPFTSVRPPQPVVIIHEKAQESEGFPIIRVGHGRDYRNWD